MATAESPAHVLGEIAEFLATGPSEEELLQFRPSESVQERARELLSKQNAGELTVEEQWELSQFEHAEVLMRLVKARIHAKKVRRP
jgi:hypothetical protein